MTTSATTLLGLALPVDGELYGTWGDTVNDSITSLLDTAVAGTTTLSADANVTLSTTDLAANQARQAIILWTAGGTVTRTITAPARSKPYILINKTSGTQNIKLVGAGPTTGITLGAGENCVAAWNGVDFIKISSSGGATGGPGNGFVYENDITVTEDYTITTDKNAMSAGPLTIDSGITVTVPSGSVWTIL